VGWTGMLAGYWGMIGVRLDGRTWWSNESRRIC
jgi:hypothetical protein